MNQIKAQATVRHLIDGSELQADDLQELISVAIDMKQDREKYQNCLNGKHVALLFEKPSLRTRLSFSVGVQDMGGNVVECIGHHHESAADTIRVIQGYCHALVVRTHKEDILLGMRPYASIPIINGLTERYHPCQILADLLSLKEHFQELAGLRLCFIGDGNNVLRSMMMLAPKLGITVHHCSPQGRQISHEEIGGDTELLQSFRDPREAVKGCQAVYTDVWQSMGYQTIDESHFVQVNEELMSHATEDAVFMHCMPMYRGREVSESLPESSQSLVFQQSKNRLYAQKALLLACIPEIK